MGRKKKPKQLYCIECCEHLDEKEFYKSTSPAPKRNDRLTICKTCMKDDVYYSKDRNRIDLKRFQKLLQKLNMPFIYNVYISASSSKGETVGSYFRMMSLQQYENMEWYDSVFSEDEKENERMKKDLITESELDKNLEESNRVKIIEGHYEDIEFLRHKFGSDFNNNDLVEFEKEYLKLNKGVSVTTEFDESNLIRASIANVRLRQVMADDKAKTQDLDRWRKLADASMKKLKAIDYTSSIGNYSSLFKALEAEEGIMEILPEFLETPKDDIDFILYSYIKKVREILNIEEDMQPGDMYKFYDELKQDWLKNQKGNKDLYGNDGD